MALFVLVLVLVDHHRSIGTTVPRLEIKDIRVNALGPITLAVAAGECVCLSGPSGSGKSRLLRAIADLDVHQGEVSLDATSRQNFPASQWRRAVGLLPPETHWWQDRVGEHLRTVDGSMLAALGLDEHLLAEPITRLSSGERQRFGLLRLLLNRPRVLLLDEPTANLDAVNTERVERVLQIYRTTNATPILWVTHDSQQIRRVANRLLYMNRGQLSDNAGDLR
ncbi:MAG: ATP-binding cassette domain-containing protein [Gammaproteobacteria bacterium]